MFDGWYSKDRVLEEFDAFGIPRSQLRRYVVRGYIEAPKKVGLGRGKGTQSWYAPDTLSRIEWVAGARVVSRHWAYLLFALCEQSANVAPNLLKAACCRLLDRALGSVRNAAKRIRAKQRSGKTLRDDESSVLSMFAMLSGRDPGFEPSNYADAFEDEEEALDLRSKPFASAAGLAPEDRTDETVLPYGSLIDGLSELNNGSPFEVRRMKRAIMKCDDDRFLALLRFGIGAGAMGSASEWLSSYVGAPKLRRESLAQKKIPLGAAWFTGFQCSTGFHFA